MRGKVIRSEVGLDLDQATPQTLAIELANKDLAEEVSRDNGGLSVEERRVEDPAVRVG
jgi:hypothetical protein